MVGGASTTRILQMKRSGKELAQGHPRMCCRPQLGGIPRQHSSRPSPGSTPKWKPVPGLSFARLMGRAPDTQRLFFFCPASSVDVWNQETE